MRNALGPSLPEAILGYCTNVHAGVGYDQMLANLGEHAVAVKQQVSPDAPMGVGLWLAAQAAREMREQQRVEAFRDWLEEAGLLAYTINGFPYGNFHEPIVKHRVYHPTWLTDERLNYTKDLSHILASLIHQGEEGSISTLPLGWRSDLDDNAIDTCAERLVSLAGWLREHENETGRLIHIDLEPEPGCAIDCCQDVLSFFDRLDKQAERAGVSGETLRRYIRVCHDICHTAVMFEDQVDTLKRYAERGIKVGKVQVSSAVQVKFTKMSDPDREVAMTQLRGFAEDRYLHQTVVSHADGNVMHEDLPAALETIDGLPSHDWRVHFHVPLFVRQFGHLESTQDDVLTLMKYVRELSDVKHFEVETYAWTVLPEELRAERLADGIAKEMQWLGDVMAPGKASPEASG